MALKWRAIGAALLETVLVLGFDVSAAHASSSAPNWGCTKHSGDRIISLSDAQEDHGVTAETSSWDDGADAEAYLCFDSTNTGRYWAVQIRDTLGDSKCAHAGLHWHKSSGTEDIDYGMYVCGANAHANFYTPTRNQTRYQYMYLSAFTDGMSDNSGGWFFYEPGL